MTKEQKLHELSKELVYQMTGNYTEDVQNADFQIAWVYLKKAMDYIPCCKSDSELLLFSADEIVDKINEQTVLDGETFRVYFREK